MPKRNALRKLEPAMTSIAFMDDTQFTVAPLSNQRFYFDISQIASICNRRFYRQGLNWAVGGIKFLTQENSIGSITVEKMHDTWITSGSWMKSFQHWKKQQDEALEAMGAEGTKARFNDYKVFLDTGHVTQYVAGGNDLNATNVLPAMGVDPTDQYETGEWEPSQVVIPNDGAAGTTLEYLVKMYGNSNAQAKSINGGYAFSRAYPTSPDPDTPDVATSWLNLMQDVGNNSDEVVDNAVDTNDNLPYDQDAYPGQGTNANVTMVHDRTLIQNTTIGGVTNLMGGQFPCGLFALEVKNFSPSDSLTFTMLLRLVPGNHRGYLAEPMAEMN
ncbi:MAG: hypothetical protein L7S49_03380 [Candidatus Poseidoniaceae archaeon]|nr:hypothetical protein [Candidatus Poseidoniaceae archaeon]